MSQPVSELWLAVNRAQASSERTERYAESCYRVLHDLYTEQRETLVKLHQRIQALETWAQGS